MTVMYFDAHSHLNFPQYDEDRDVLIEQMRETGIWTITVGTNMDTSREAVELARRHPHLFATVGVHPTDWELGLDVDVARELARGTDTVVAIGECGLDYFRGTEGMKQQKGLFEQHITLARELGLPLMIHARPSKGTMDAYHDVLDILMHHQDVLLTDRPGDVHFFVGDVPVAKKFLELGFTLSFDGPITFTDEYDDVVQYVPLDMILVETDAPFAAPDPYRGKRNEPQYVKEVVHAVARIKGMDDEVVRTQTVANTLRVFNITV